MDDKYEPWKDYGTTKEIYNKLKNRVASDAICGSCGWHPCFYEVEDQIFPDIFDEEEWDAEGNFFIYCNYKDDPYSDTHRGIYIHVKDIITKNQTEVENDLENNR